MPNLDEAVATAYQQGLNDGYALATAQDDLDLQAIKKDLSLTKSEEEILCSSQQQTA
ncbi:MAG: hypothetical protein ISS52_01650 [Dehalococcoidia bacterium]|nr:hypothetical protein [Dehalococcoidia bacterium]